MRQMKHLFTALLLATTCSGIAAQADDGLGLLEAISDAAPAPLIAKHVYGGMPIERGTLYVRQGYVLAYEPELRVPAWVAYHLTPEYLSTPPRDGRFDTFRVDPDVDQAPRTAEYIRSGYDRGHLAPYFAMGGDRDNDGLFAADGDEHDMLTVFQANYMANIAPQYAGGFNQSPGLWFTLETWIRETVVREQGRDTWVFAGSIFGPKRYDVIGPEQDIEVPPMFFMLVVIEQDAGELPVALAYLLPHQQVRHGEPEHFLVSVRLLEAMTDLTFFRDLVDLHGEETIADWKAEDSWSRWPVFGE